jgi:tRNA dimethylallyltransferase
MLPIPKSLDPAKLNSEKEIQEKLREFLSQNSKGIVEILGPTASGKTGYSIKLVKWIEENFDEKCEIISVDSRQVFRDMDISSAKITPEEMQGVPHHGLDLCNPDEEFSVVHFQRYAFEKIAEIQARGNRVILCGGTMLWLDAISENYIFADDKDQKSVEKGEPKWNFFKIGMYWDRKKLYERTDLRSQILFNNGLVAETREILQKYDITRSAMTSFGYLEIKEYFDGKVDLETALANNQQKNRKYAKKQLTWWRGREDVNWLDVGSL